MNSLQRFIAFSYIYRFLGEFIIILPVFAVMFADHGLTTFEISILFVAWSATSFLLEVPTGVIADRYPRKYLLTFASIAKTLCFVCWFVFPTFAGFLAGFILWGICDALVSGTFSALVYDELKSAERESSYVKVSGRASTAYFIGTLLAALAGSILVIFGYPFLLLASIAASLLTAGITLLFPQVAPMGSTGERRFLAQAIEGFTILKTNARVRGIVMISSVTAMVSMGLMEFWTLIANAIGVPHQGLGILIALIAGGQGVAGFIAHRYEQLSKSALNWLFSLGGILVLGLAALMSIPALMLAIIFVSLFTFLGVIYEAQLQHAIPSELRATVSSVESFITRFGVFATFLVFGAIASSFSYAVALSVFGMLIVGIGIGYLFLPRLR